jgi:hypothetical protein
MSETSTEIFDALTNIGIYVEGITSDQSYDLTVREVLLGESLLTPGLQTSVKVHSYFHGLPVKNLNLYKEQDITIKINKPVLAQIGVPEDFITTQTIYRIDNRRLIGGTTEEFIIHACHDTQLEDAKTLVSKSWKCVPPSEIVEYVLGSCVGAENPDIEQSDPARDYIAENVHPFQVVSAQAGYALARGSDPSFLHYMTYLNNSSGVHHFRSLATLTRQSPKYTFIFNESNNAYANPYSILSYSFPCDFDLLSDILNGINGAGDSINSIMLFNPANKTFSLMGGDDAGGCGNGSAVMKAAISNQNSAKDQDSCPDYAKEYLLKRQARMGLLEKDKIALRMTVPFNPALHAGNVIRAEIVNKEAAKGGYRVLNYGSGDYLILHLYHRILNGGYSTTEIDCVARTFTKEDV